MALESFRIGKIAIDWGGVGKVFQRVVIFVEFSEGRQDSA